MKHPALLAIISFVAFLVVFLVMVLVTKPFNMDRDKEGFSVMYPSNEKLRGGWDRTNVLTAVMPGGRLR